jgi:hypothetical protein
MRYDGSITLSFSFDVPGDDPVDDPSDRNADTAPAAAAVIGEAMNSVANLAFPYLAARFDDPQIVCSGEPTTEGK